MDLYSSSAGFIEVIASAGEIIVDDNLFGEHPWLDEDTENVHVIVSAHGGQASFMQMLRNPINSGVLDDRFYESRPFLAVYGDSSWNQSYVHTLKFRSTIYAVRCSSRIVAVLLAAQIHCFDHATLELNYTIATNLIACGSFDVGYGPLAVGPRWIAYSGSHIANSSSAQFTSELISLSSSPGVAQFARETIKQLASGIVYIGDRGYRSLTKYCAEVLLNPYIPVLKGIGVDENVADADSIGMVIIRDITNKSVILGMVIIRDITNKSVISQFKAHKSPISALCFDPSGMFLVTASIQGHNINVFRIMPTISPRNDANTTTFAHLFRLQHGFTNAVIQDISFNNDSNLIVVSSSRGTSHLFEINPEKEGDSPVPLSAINRIRSGWIGTVSGAASAAAGMDTLYGHSKVAAMLLTKDDLALLLHGTGHFVGQELVDDFDRLCTFIFGSLTRPPEAHYVCFKPLPYFIGFGLRGVY